ncbi:DUF6941 family protein [Curtobacterium oceanosedimentum]|uniref:DUF6941 family protein n=1 Tax=Curtobacterium oceanosedimentum TaxID=465820 RepID=UPI001CE1DA7C|nr:hypothetical protein [Curtobacterium oceanosedimentum]MCA5924341.1 hypothetical protein [Curtobacterium oceanosedimentum]
MTINITAFLADSAESVNGKLYVLGAGWDTLAVSQVPAVQQRVAVGVLVQVGWNDTGVEHDVTLRLETEDGEPVPLARHAAGMPEGTAVAAIGHRFTTGRSTLLRAGDDQTHPVTFTINDLLLERVGGYSWVIEVDGEIAHRLAMRVVQHTP